MTFRIRYLSLILLMLFAGTQLYGQTIPARPGSWAKKADTCQLKNLYKLNDSIYRSEQPDLEMFSCLAKTGIRGVLNLRSYHSDSDLVNDSVISIYTVNMIAKKFTDSEIIESLRILRGGTKPLLVHCLHGSDRTGVVIAMYRIIFENWTREQALDELQHGGYGFHKQYTNMIRYIKNADIELIKNKVINE